MNDSERKLQALLKIKNFENPAPGYFETFLDEFHRCQRAESLRHSAQKSFFKQAQAWFEDLGKWRWLYLGTSSCTAAALIFFGALLMRPAVSPPNEGSSFNSGLTPASLQKQPQNAPILIPEQKKKYPKEKETISL